ncbi:MAG: response regulator [Roseiflexaceae bacterium]|nr:response regulator [Roseiflexaceae bacterium]
MLTSFDWQLQRKIRVLIATDDTALSERLWAFLEQSGETRPIATSTNGRDCLEMLKNQAPDVMLVADNLPGEDVIDLCREAIHIHPRIAPIILSNGTRYRDAEYLHTALDVGVCDLLKVEPPYAELRFQHIISSITQAYNLIQERVSGVGGGIGRVISLFSLKGGVGTSTVAANLAMALSHQDDRRRVMLADFNWRFGGLDAAVGHVAHQSVLELIPVLDGITRTDLESIAPPIGNGLRLLPAPLDSERTEFTRDLLEREVLEDDRATMIDDLLMRIRERRSVQIDADKTDYLEMLLKKEKIKQILSVLARRTLQSLRRNYHYITVDTGAYMDDVALTTLEMSDLVLLVCTPDVPSIRATRAALTLLTDLGVSRESIGYVVNRSSRKSEISLDDIRSLFTGYEMIGEVPADYRALQPFANTGALIAEAGDSPMARSFRKLASQVQERTPIARAA